MLHDWYNRSIREIWSRHAKDAVGLPGMLRFPMQRPPFVERPRLVFVGMNPSFAREGTKPEDHERYAWNDAPSAAQLEDFIAAEAAARKQDDPNAYNKYYGPLRRFAASLMDDGAAPMPIEFLDVLPIRHTSQKHVVASYFPASNPHAIAAECLDLFEETLRQLAPPIAIVANATAARTLHGLFSLKSPDDKRSYQAQRIPSTRFFLSAMFSCGALDTFSRDRLAADVRVVLKLANPSWQVPPTQSLGTSGL